MHSHNYSPAQARKRRFGDARAIGKAWRGDAREYNWLRTVALGWLGDLRHDLRFCAREGRLREWPHAAVVRWHERNGRLAGFRQGRAEAAREKS
jgi:rhamnosyltransferase